MFSNQVDKTLLLFIKIFYITGIWQRDEESHLRKIGKKFLYSVFGTWFPIFLATNAFLCTDRDESIFSVQTSILTFVIYVKLLYLLFKKEAILAFLNDQIVGHSFDNREGYEQAGGKTKKLMKFVRPYTSAIFLTGALVVVSKLPMFSADKGLPMFISFSWNNSEIIYWLAYLLQSLSAILYCTTNLISPLIWYIMLNYSVEYELLGNKLKNLGVGKKTIKAPVKNQIIFSSAPRSPFVEDLVVWIKAHRNLTETVERFRSCFSTLFFGQIATSAVGICVSVYNLAFFWKENLIQTEFYVVLLLYGIFDIFLVMYLANEITLGSDRLSYCLFESNWLEQTESCKKYVLIVGEVLKQPQQLVIWIYPMNLETFMRIVNGAYSMFNILKSFQ